MKCMRRTKTELQIAFFLFWFSICIKKTNTVLYHKQQTFKQQTAEDTTTQSDIYWDLHVSGTFMLRLTRLVFPNVLYPMDLTIALVVLATDSW